MRPPTKASTIFHLFLCTIFYFFCVSVTTAKAAPPVVDSVSGELADGQSITISGSGFGQKSPAAPLRYMNFEDGINGQEVPNNEDGGGLYIEGMHGIVYDDTYQRFPGAQNLQQNFNDKGGAAQFVGLYNADTITSDRLYMHGYWRIETHGAASRNAKFLNLAATPFGSGDWQTRVDADNNACTTPNAIFTMWEGCPSGENNVMWIGGLAAKVLGDDGGWHRIDSYIELPAGYRDLYVDNELMGVNQTTDMTAGCSDKSIGYVLFGQYYDSADCTPKPEAERWWDEIYIDTTRARVEMCDSDEWSSRSHCEIQIPSAWSESSLTFTVNQGSFQEGATAYLFVVDADGNVSNGKEVVIGGGSELTIDTSTLPDAELNTAYSQTLSAFGGESPYLWSLESGTLPAGLSLNSSGVLSGTPTVAGVYDFTVEVTDSATPTPNTDTQLLSINVSSETTHTVTFTEGANGSRTGGGALVQTVNHGSAATAPIITANAGYTFDGWDIAFSNVTSDLTVTAQYTQNSYTLTYTAGPNGSITGTSPQFVLHGANAETVTAVPDTGYHFVNWSDEVTTASRTDINVTADITVTANFEIDTIPVVDVKINFQPADAAVPDGYLVDSGAAFGDRGNGYSYGWNEACSFYARDRNNASSPDQRYDTLMIMQYESGSFTWEIALPNGDYNVRLVGGDGTFPGEYNLNAEGVNIFNGPTSDGEWLDNTVRVTVTDGNLSLTNADATSANKVCFIEITSSVPGDIDQDGDIDLTDAILGLQIATGSTPVTISPDGDVGGDSKIGIEEVIYILQSVQSE